MIDYRKVTSVKSHIHPLALIVRCMAFKANVSNEAKYLSAPLPKVNVASEGQFESLQWHHQLPSHMVGGGSDWQLLNLFIRN